MTAPTDAERALEIVADHRAWLGDCLCGTQAHEGCAGLAARIAAALAEERERAARIAETAAASAEGFNDVARNFATNIADAIRRQEGRDA